MPFSSNIVCWFLVAAAPPAGVPNDADAAFFESRIRPILVARCYECHSERAGKSKGGLRLDSREGLAAGGDSGPAVTLGAASPNVDDALLIEAVGYAVEGFQMPPAGKLPDAEIALLKEWVRRGAPYPAGDATATAARRGIDVEAGRNHWAFQPARRRPLPAGIDVADPNDGAARIDAFVEARRRATGLAAAPEADARTLIRRVTFDLIGLPPTAEEVDAFVRSCAPSDPRTPARAPGVQAPEQENAKNAAYAALVDRLLASPHYGERWGRYWLDLARYADVTESWREGDGKPWLYRDWVVRAFNDDVPYDRFVRMQFAADLLPGAKPEDNAALGFLGLSPAYWKELKLDPSIIKQVVADEWEERIDTIGQTFLGLALGCARCHDHKYDPIATTDYYGLAGVLASVRSADLPVVDPATANEVRRARTEVKQLQAKLAEGKKKKPAPKDAAAQEAELARRIADLERTPRYDDALACGIVDAAVQVLPDGTSRTKIEYASGRATNLALHIRGNPNNVGVEVPRRFPAVLAADRSATFHRGSGRLDLAEAIVGDAGSLAARVVVNRVWAGHFGRGIVATPSNFGTRGDAPTHPELLDDLTARFMADGWSLKRLHREILLSRTYRQASANPDVRGLAADPANVGLWRASPRRLDVEAWRDAILAATGELDRSIGGPPVELTVATHRRRTLYGVVKRRELSDLLRLYDFPDPVTHAAQREPTTTPLQQLFALNNPWPAERAAALVAVAERQATSTTTEAERIGTYYRRLFARAPDVEERAAGEAFLAAAVAQGANPVEARRRYAHVLLMSNELQLID